MKTVGLPREAGSHPADNAARTPRDAIASLMCERPFGNPLSRRFGVGNSSTASRGISLWRKATVMPFQPSEEDNWGNEAETMNIDRSNVGRQLAFGFGRHSCLGMHFARLEMSATPEAMIRHVPDIQIENPEFATITTVRGSERMTACFCTH